MNDFNVIIWNCNSKKFEPYDIMPYLREQYEDKEEKPSSFAMFKEFVKDESLYQFWSRCEYEIILMDWPCQSNEEKWDVHKQIMMNLDLIARLLMEDVLQ